MMYQSTRGHGEKVNALQAVLRGLAPDGGLYLPQNLSAIPFEWKCTLNEDTMRIAARVLSALLPDYADMDDLVSRAYTGKFETEELTPTVPVGEDYVLELFRGPTSAFKDVALSMLPQLLCAAKAQLGDTDTTLILTATSGDTGKAALAGFADVPGVKIVVFYPDQGVSAVQKAQMVTQTGANVKVCAVNGNFDDAQTGVKKIFAACAQGALPADCGVALSSANSINIGRLVPQVTYYFKAYADLVRTAAVMAGDPVDFVVPTGNFGDILAGYFAKILGLPVGMLVCASNANNVLTDFLTTGCYDRRRVFHKTASPSMDILVSSNLERLLYLMTDGDTAVVAEWMRRLNEEGVYQVPEEVLRKLKKEFWAGCCDDTATARTIREVWENHGYLMDTHTAVAWNVAQQYKAAVDAKRPVVVLSTASPYKFPTAVLGAVQPEQNQQADEFEQMEHLQEISGVKIPANLAGLRSREVLHRDCIDPEEMLEYVLAIAGVK